jgi:hypothetical protein
MVSFRTIVTSALALTVPIVAHYTPGDVAQGINALGKKTKDFTATAEKITVLDEASFLLGKGSLAEAVAGCKSITNTLGPFIKAIGNVPHSLQGDDSRKIITEFSTVCFINSHISW